MKIAVVGSGYVGLVAGACFADLGHDVIVVDNDQQKLAALNRGEVPIHENFLPELLDRGARDPRDRTPGGPRGNDRRGRSGALPPGPRDRCRMHRPTR